MISNVEPQQVIVVNPVFYNNRWPHLCHCALQAERSWLPILLKTSCLHPPAHRRSRTAPEGRTHSWSASWDDDRNLGTGWWRDSEQKRKTLFGLFWGKFWYLINVKNPPAHKGTTNYICDVLRGTGIIIRTQEILFKHKNVKPSICMGGRGGQQLFRQYYKPW